MNKIEVEALKKHLIEQFFPNKNWIEDSIVGVSVEKAFNLAWERGHSGGEFEIEQEFRDLVDIIKPLID